MANDEPNPFASASRWSRRSSVDGEEVLVASPHAIEDGDQENLDVWLRYRGSNYATTAYSVADLARLVERDFVHYDVSWFVLESITEDNLMRAITEIITSGGLDTVFQPMIEL